MRVFLNAITDLRHPEQRLQARLEGRITLVQSFIL
jgi:hypothetical protein